MPSSAYKLGYQAAIHDGKTHHEYECNAAQLASDLGYHGNARAAFLRGYRAYWRGQ